MAMALTYKRSSYLDRFLCANEDNSLFVKLL